jgi:hypothetical protein
MTRLGAAVAFSVFQTTRRTFRYPLLLHGEKPRQLSDGRPGPDATHLPDVWRNRLVMPGPFHVRAITRTPL